jgi:polyferredoxin
VLSRRAVLYWAGWFVGWLVSSLVGKFLCLYVCLFGMWDISVSYR